MSCGPPSGSVPSRNRVKLSPPRGEEAVHRHAIAGVVGDRLAVQPQIEDALPRRPGEVVAVGQPARGQQHDRALERVAAAVELLLEHGAELAAGEALHHQIVAEGLGGEELAEGDAAVGARG